jgi:hypothetical protein
VKFEIPPGRIGPEGWDAVEIPTEASLGTRELYAQRYVQSETRRRLKMGRGLLLWLIGIPIPIILLIWLFGGLH